MVYCRIIDKELEGQRQEKIANEAFLIDVTSDTIKELAFDDTHCHNKHTPIVRYQIQ